VIEVSHAGNDVKLPGLATTETLTRHVNLNYFSELQLLSKPSHLTSYANSVYLRSVR